MSFTIEVNLSEYINYSYPAVFISEAAGATYSPTGASPNSISYVISEAVTSLYPGSNGPMNSYY